MHFCLSWSSSVKMSFSIFDDSVWHTINSIDSRKFDISSTIARIITDMDFLYEESLYFTVFTSISDSGILLEALNFCSGNHYTSELDYDHSIQFEFVQVPQKLILIPRFYFLIIYQF